jgi:LPXTG-motif cell wall-anchored protein
MIIAKDIPVETIAAQKMTVAENNLWILWAVSGAGLIILFFVFSRRKKRDKNEG